MPTVANHTPYATLLPPSGWQMDPATFAAETERNDDYGATFDWPGWSSKATDEVPPVGVVSDLGYLLEGSTVTTKTTGTIAATDRWPHGVIDRYQLRLNSQATPWSLPGMDLNVLRQARTRGVAASGDTSTIDTAGGTNPLRVMFHVPLSIDPSIAPSTGGIFAQSVNSQIVSEITTAAKADVVTLTGDGTFDLSGATFRRMQTWYSIPVGKMANGGVGMILPDLSVMHGVLSQDVTFTSTGDLRIELNRIQGTIARMWLRLENGQGNASLDPFSVLDSVRFQYATNQQPRTYHPRHIEALQDAWYRGSLPYKALALDSLAESLVRDAIDVEALSNPQLIPTITSGTTINSGARAYLAYEVLAPLA